MNLIICLTGEAEQLAFLPEIASLGAGIELGSYGLAGIRSEQQWEARVRLHQELRARFAGPLAIHGPFLGMEFAHLDHLIRAAVQRRLDMLFDVALQLGAGRIILHSGYTVEMELFDLDEQWLTGNISFWQREIQRWADAGIQIVLENDIEKSPDLLIRLVDGVGAPSLGLCMDIGHQHVFSSLDAPSGCGGWAGACSMCICTTTIARARRLRSEGRAGGRFTAASTRPVPQLCQAAPSDAASRAAEDPPAGGPAPPAARPS